MAGATLRPDDRLSELMQRAQVQDGPWGTTMTVAVADVAAALGAGAEIAERLLHALVQSAADVVLVFDEKNRFRYGSPAAGRLLGLQSGVHVRALIESTIHPDDQARVLQAIAHAARTAAGQELIEFRVRRRDGAWRDVEAATSRLPAELALRGTVVNLHDVTERKRAEMELQAFRSYLALVARGRSDPAAVLDHDATLQREARLAVPGLADYCFVHAVEEDGAVRVKVAAHGDPRKEPMLEELHRRTPAGPGDGDNLVGRVLETGEPLLIPDLSVNDTMGTALGDGMVAVHEVLQPVSLMVLPLVASGRLAGAITFCLAESMRRYSADDLVLGQDLASRVALALENVRLMRQHQAAIEQASGATAARDALIAAVSREIGAPLTGLRSALHAAGRALRRGEGATRAEAIVSRADARVERLVQLVSRLADGAHGGDGARVPAGVSPVPKARLSPREREVVSLVVRGLTNRQIGEALVLSERTVEHHIGRVLARLRLSSRTQLAAFAIEHRLLDTRV